MDPEEQAVHIEALLAAHDIERTVYPVIVPWCLMKENDCADPDHREGVRVLPLDAPKPKWLDAYDD
ncbi:MAG TPA: hypothetical protein VH573_08475, partial [Mycobacteriales bacterium]